MDDDKMVIVEQAESLVERAKIPSKQPKFKSTDEFFAAMMHWTEQFEAMPTYAANSRPLDKWLSRFWMQEPFLSGVVFQAVAMVKNRGWKIVGGRNQVNRFTNILLEADAGAGWRDYISRQATAFYTTNMGSITEIGRAGRDGPMRAIFHTDPTKCVATSNIEFPLRYFPGNRSRMQEWRPDDFMRVQSMPVIEDEFNRLGFCAVHRAIEITQIMLALTRHSQEKLGARAPKGLLLLQNVPAKRWEEAMEQAETHNDAKDRLAFGGVMVLATVGTSAPDAKLVELSRLPDGFSQTDFINQMMYAYALCFGFDPAEFWPVQFGSLGRGTESQVQHEKATGKGGLDFILSYQNALEANLPPALLFEFEQRDQAADKMVAELQKIWADIAKVYSDTASAGEAVLSRDEIRSLLVENQIIPQEWTETEEDLQSTDTESNRLLKARLRDRPSVRDAAARFPSEPIIVYRWPADRQVMLWPSGADMLRRTSFPAAHPARVRYSAEDSPLFEDEESGLVITERDVQQALAEAKKRVGSEFFDLLTAPTMTTDEEDEEEIQDEVAIESG